MEKNYKDTEKYNAFVKVLNNYLFKNYSKDFIKSLKRWNIIKSSISGNKAVGEVIRTTGDSFIIKIDLYNKTIIHIGYYNIHRNTSMDEIFKINNKIKINT